MLRLILLVNVLFVVTSSAALTLTITGQPSSDEVEITFGGSVTLSPPADTQVAFRGLSSLDETGGLFRDLPAGGSTISLIQDDFLSFTVFDSSTSLFLIDLIPNLNISEGEFSDFLQLGSGAFTAAEGDIITGSGSTTVNLSDSGLTFSNFTPGSYLFQSEFTPGYEFVTEVISVPEVGVSTQITFCSILLLAVRRRR